MIKPLFAHNRVLREKEVLRQDANLVHRIQSAKCKIDAGVPRSMSAGRNGRRLQTKADRQEDIVRNNNLLLSKLKKISTRPNQSSNDLPGIVDMSQHHASCLQREKIVEFRRESRQSEIDSKNLNLMKRLAKCKANLTSLNDSDKIYAPAGKSGEGFFRRKSVSRPSSVETALTRFAKNSYIDTNGLLRLKQNDITESRIGFIGGPSTSTICADLLFNPFKKSDKEAKKQEQQYSFFRLRKRTKDLGTSEKEAVEAQEFVASGLFKDGERNLLYFISKPSKGRLF